VPTDEDRWIWEDPMVGGCDVSPSEIPRVIMSRHCSSVLLYSDTRAIFLLTERVSSLPKG